jgi:hypothetical protein
LAGRAHALTPVTSPAVLAAVLGGAELVVAMRLHSGILAATAGTPAVVIDYDPKTRAFAAQTGQSRWAVSVDDLEAMTPGTGASPPGTAAPADDQGAGPGVAALVEAIMDTMAGLPARRAALARAVAPLRADAGRTAGLAVQLAATGGVTTGGRSALCRRGAARDGE